MIQHDTPRAYAWSLAAYISDPSTIRVRVIEWFGEDRAPSVEDCRKMREQQVARRKVKTYADRRRKK